MVPMNKNFSMLNDPLNWLIISLDYDWPSTILPSFCERAVTIKMITMFKKNPGNIVRSDVIENN